jgi:tetratricopeptide (TPR) repeat protein
MSQNGEKPYKKPKRFIKRENFFLDLLKIFTLAAVISLAGWGIAVRGERLRQAEIIADIASSGVGKADELTALKRMIDKNELQEAIQGLLSITREEPENFVAHYLLGVAYAKKGLHGEALSQFDKVLELGGWEAQTHYNRGVVYESLGFYDKAYSAYEAARRADPEKREYLRARDKVDYVYKADLGLDYQYQMRFNEASAALIRVPPDLEFASNTFEYLVGKFPHKVEPLHMLAVVRSRQGQMEEAEEIFNRAIGMEPGFALSHYNLGILYQTQGRWEEARESFLKCLRLTPDEKNRAVVSSHIQQVEKHIPGFNGD